MTRESESESGRRGGKFLRAKWRHRILTLGADRLTGGRLSRGHAQQPTVVRRFDLAMPDWPLAWDGLRIGHFSDMHFGDLMPVDRAIGVVELLGAQKPDLVAFTGDMVDLECDGAGPIFAATAAIDAPLGACMVVGNHDLLDDGDEVRAMATAAGVRVLDDQAIELTAAPGALPHVGRDGSPSDPLVVAGIDWDKSVKALRSRVEGVSETNPTLLLAHNPKAFLAASKLGIPLTLAGHTHGGQVARKGRPEVNLAVAHRLSAGFYHREASTLFVTVGTGSWFPLRVQCPAEVVVLTCRRGEGEVRELGPEE